MKYHSIYLLGFRATGKSTIGPLLAKKLKWGSVEMDHEVEKNAGKTILELTKKGTTWDKFRKLEHDLLKEFLEKKYLVVSTGGGVAVNTIYGETNRKLLWKNKKVLLVLLTAGEKQIADRIWDMEVKSKKIMRPLLNSQKAKDVNARVKNLDESEKKHYLIEEIVRDSLELYKKRQKLYLSLTKNVIDTGLLSVEESVSKIISLL